MTSLKELEHLSLPFPVIEAATNNFTTVIGRGGFGSVYKGQLSLSGQLTTVAVKRLDTKLSGQGLNEFLMEILLLSRYKHRNLVSLLAFCNQGDEKILIYEYAHSGSLDKSLRNAQNPTCQLTWEKRLNICIDAARGLNHLHNHLEKHQRVIHRDIKSANILIDNNGKAMIADLGLSKLGRANGKDSFIVTNACGTEGYCDPVYRQTGKLTKESDVYSFGVVLFEVLCGRLCLDKIGYKQLLLPQVAQNYYRKRKLNQIIDPTLSEYMDTNSVKKFSRIAYQCLLEDREGRPSMDMVLQELEKALELLLFLTGDEDNNHEIESSEVTLSRGNWIPICLPKSWDEDIPTLNQAELRVRSDFIATGAPDSTGVDESFREHMGLTVNNLRKKQSDYNHFLVKSFSDIKKSLENNEGRFGDSYGHWVAVVELTKEVTSWAEDASGRVVYEFVACVRIIISSVAQGLKASMATKHAEVATNALNKILGHVKASSVIDTLLSCLVTCGTSLMSGSSKLLRASCEACEAIWSLIDAFEIRYKKKIAPVFPLSSMYSHSLDRINFKGDECGPLINKYSENIVEAVTQAFVRSEAVRVVIFYCLRQRLEASWSSVVQIILRCCLHNDLVTSVLCGLSNSSVVGGGGDNTIISEVFSIISLCASFDRDPQPGDTNNLKSKVSNPSDLILHTCLFVASVARSIDSPGGNTAVILLTSSPETQRSRLSDLAHHYSLCNGIQDIQPHSMSAMLAFAYMCSLENNESVATSIRGIALPLIPPSTKLCDYLRMLTTDAQGDKTGKIMLSYWHGFRDGCVILLFFRLAWGGPLAIQDLGGSDIPQSLIDLLGNKHSDEVGLSPLGVTWTLSSIRQCLQGGSSVFRQVLLRREHVKILCDLISDVHLKLLRCWVGPGGGKSGFKDTVNRVVNLLTFPFVASVESWVLQNMSSPDKKDLVLEIKTSMNKYIQILLEVGLPRQIIKCLEHLELEDTTTTLSFLSEMVFHRPLVVELVSKGLLNPNLMKRLLDYSSPTQLKLKVLKIVSEVAQMGKEFYEHINGADILQQLKGCLTHEDPGVRGWTCGAIGDMCLHGSYFYSLLAQHNIISLLVDRLFDKDEYPLRTAVFAITYIVKYSDLFYEDLRICIPQLAELLLSAEMTNLTKINVATCLGNLCVHSDNLSQDMTSKGGSEALLKVVTYCSVVVLDPSRVDANNQSLLYKALDALATMVVHRSLVVELVSKGLLNPNLMKRLLDYSSPTQLKLRVLKIVSEVAQMGKEFYEHINGADILQQLKGCLTHEDPDVRGWTCRAIGDMCLHGSYFYSLLARHNVISLLVDLLFDKDEYPQRRAVYAITYIVKHSDLFYEDLRICIPQLAELLLSAETTNLTKKNIATCLGNLCVHSDNLSQDMTSKGGSEALLKVVTDCSVVVLDPSRVDANNKSLLYKALDALATMVVHRSLVVELVSKGLLNPNLMKRLLDYSSPTQLKKVLKIVSGVAQMGKEFYEHINGADILQQLKGCLTHEDPGVRGWTCGAIGDMCLHGSYFYSLLAQHNIISLLVDRLFDKDEYPLRTAVFAITYIVKHSDLFYEDLRICIPQLAELLLSAETTNLTKKNIATCLGNLCVHSDNLSQDMTSKGGSEALLKVVTDCSVVVLDPSRVDANNQSLLYEALDALATMVVHRSLVVELFSKGLLNPNLMKRLLDYSSPTQLKLKVLKIVSEVAQMGKEFYEHINGADILQQLKGCLTHEDPDVRGWTCRAIGDMCLHGSYFYSLLARHNVISLLVDLLFDKDEYPQRLAVFAIMHIVKHSDLFYEDLRICIPQLAKLLLSAEMTNLTKKNIATCLGNLCVHSDNLSQDMTSKGGSEALLKVVTDCSIVVLNPSRVVANNQSLLYKALDALATMVVHRSLVVELVSKGLLNPNLMKRLLDYSSPTQLKLKVLKIVSGVAQMGKEFYEHINGADILQQLKGCLTHEDPGVRGWTCGAIGDMCLHGSYFYSLLAQHNIISLLVDRLFDKDEYPLRTAVFAITYIVKYSDLFYEDLRICIPQLAELLLSAETTNLTKINVSTCLGNLCVHSDNLSQDMTSKGGSEALLKVVTYCSVVVLDPSRVDANNQSLLYEALDALATMVVHRSLVVELVSKGLLNPNLMKRLLDYSSPTQLKLRVLKIVSEVAQMGKEFYEHINGADILQQLKGCLTHEDPDVRGWTCRAIGDMCLHGSYFYSLLARHNVISLLVDLLFDKDEYPQRRAVYAITYIVKHSDLFYEDLRICIPQLAELLLSAETTNLTKKNIATCLGNLCVHSDNLSQDMTSKGGSEALLKVVTDCSVVVLDPSRVDANNQSLLYEALDALATMVVHRSLVVELVSKGLLNPNLMKRLLDYSSPTQLKLRVLKIVSEVAQMGKEFYEHINGADILQQLKGCLTHEDPDVRGWTCRAIGDMCLHGSYFYSLLARHNVISLLVDLLFDKDEYPQRLAVFAIMHIVKHSDLFYEDLRICIPQLAKLLLSAEMTNLTKKNIATCLGNLCVHSDNLSQDMTSKGGSEALLKVVTDCSVVVLDPSRVDANNQSLLYEALDALATMCKHRPCRKFIGSSKVYPVIGKLRQSPVENIASKATLIFKRSNKFLSYIYTG